ncbi:LysR family transcriptional regulator [Spongorhabdus nitratireducens]
MIERRHLHTLTTLRDSGSLIEAAQRLHLTQSALSHQLKDLEQRLNLQLFVRKSRPLRFTTAGQRLLALADSVLPQFRQTERELLRLSQGETGRLHIAIECHSCFQWLMPAIDAFRDHWPDVEMDLASGFNFAPLPALTRGDLDLVVTSNPQSLPGISYIPLFSYEVLLAVSHRHPLAESTFIQAQDLAAETLISYPVERERLDIFTQLLDPAGIEPAAIRTAELTVMMLQLVASGRGVCALPNWALAEHSDKRFIRALPLGEKGIWTTLYAAVREDQLEMSFMRDFLGIAKDICFSSLTGVRPASKTV